MSTTVKSLKVTYNSINERNSFTNGDWISGEVTIDLAKDCQIDTLLLKFKGKAEVMWTERYGKTTVVFHAKEKYFSIKHYFIRDKNIGDDNQILLRNQHGETYCSVVAPGCHVYPFTFQIPFENVPSSFRGSVGKIVYSLEAKLSRSMRIPKKDLAYINFAAKADLNSVPRLMTPQHEFKDKQMKFFNSGTVSMDVNIEKMGFLQGEELRVVALIQNNSSREIKPKYSLYKKHSFFAQGKRNHSTSTLCKEVGEAIPPSTNQKVTKVITIPHDLEPSILNCKIIKVEYRLKVYLDVKFASDPEIKFPIVILPASHVPAVAPPAAYGFGSEQCENPEPPAWGFYPPQPPAAPQPYGLPPPYGADGMYPSLTDFDIKYQ